jgi:hypothetical protein
MSAFATASAKKFIEKPRTKMILDSFTKSLIFDFEEYAYQNTLLIQKLRKINLLFNSGDSCYTNHHSIVLGTEFTSFNNVDDKPAIILKRAQGIVAHEFAHILYTDAKDWATFLDKAPHTYKKTSNLAKFVLNVLEDYRIENRFSNDNKYYKKLFFMTRYHIIKNLLSKWDETVPSTDKEVADAVVNSFLIMGFTKKPVFSKSKKVNAMILALYPLVMKAENAADTKEIVTITDRVLTLLEKLDIVWDSSPLTDEAKALTGKLSSRIGSPGNSSGGQAGPGGTGKATATNVDDSDEVQDITKNIDNVEPLEASDLEEELEQELENQLEEMEQQGINESLISGFLYGEKDESKKEAEFKEIKDIASLADVVPAIHKNCKLRVNERMQRFHPEDYDELRQNLKLPISKLVNKISELKQSKIDDYEYFLRGGSLDTNALTRFVSFNNFDIFKQENVEEENMAMDVMVLVDCSGSNASSVLNKVTEQSLPRYQVNQMMSIYLHEALKNLGFKHSIWGFDSSGVETISPMVNFTNCFDADSGLNLLDIGARSANRDGYHIRLAGNHLNDHSTNNKKLLIVISDGQPSSNGYGGAPAMKDIVETQEDLKKLGIVTAGIFTGHEEENKYFSDMYEKAFFLNNESIFDFEKTFFDLISKEFEDDDINY